MPRVLAAVVAILLAAVMLALPAGAEARPGPLPKPAVQAPTPTPTPTATATATPFPSPTQQPTNMDGVDVSYHQGTIAWPQVAGAGKRFAFIRASAGTLTADPAYAVNSSGARAAGLTVGSYHFANPDFAPNDAANEAAWFLRHATFVSGDLVPVLDLEVTNGLDAASLAVWAQTWLDHVSAATGVRPIIYTNAAFWRTSMADTDWFARNGHGILFIAHWTPVSDPTVPASSWGGNGWTFWQHSSAGSVAGINGPVDLDRFRGTTFTSELLVP